MELGMIKIWMATVKLHIFPFQTNTKVITSLHHIVMKLYTVFLSEATLKTHHCECCLSECI